jgi:hypothetical protein
VDAATRMYVVEQERQLDGFTRLDLLHAADVIEDQNNQQDDHEDAY